MPENQSQNKTPFLQLLYGIGYFLLFFVVQYFTSFVFTIYYGLQKTASDRAKGIPLNPDALTEYLQIQITENMNYLLTFYSALFIIVLLIIFTVRRKNFLEETQLRKFSAGSLPGILLLTLGLFLFINGCLNLLPNAWLEDYSESSSFISKGSFAFSMISQGLIAPLIEEIVFRGLMLSRFNVAFPKWFGIMVSSLLFGFVHGNPVWFVFAALIGIILCLVATKTNSILSTFIIHALFNSCGTLISYNVMVFTLPTLICAAAIGAIFMGSGIFLIWCQPAAVRK